VAPKTVRRPGAGRSANRDLVLVGEINVARLLELLINGLCHASPTGPEREQRRHPAHWHEVDSWLGDKDVPGMPSWQWCFRRVADL
jgi:hypothetical protein